MPETDATLKNAASVLVQQLHDQATRIGRPVAIMEVCGTHTVTARQSGLHGLLPQSVRLISGPGCPVCVTPTGYIDQAVELATKHHVHIMTYGDMVRVPGNQCTLDDARRDGGKLSVIYSIHDALAYAKEHTGEQVVFLGIGFETTAPATAVAITTAKNQQIKNVSVLNAHKRIIPAMEALIKDPELAIDGFVGPGHVSVIIGTDAYETIAAQYHRPCVIAGFDGLQMLSAIAKILLQISQNDARIETVYGDRVRRAGNLHALDMLDQVFEPATANWRGLGAIPQSGLVLKKQYRDFDAAVRFDLTEIQDTEPPGCRCGDIIKGKINPDQCPLFGDSCTPANPVGACMVSREGSCQAWYRYQNSKLSERTSWPTDEKMSSKRIR